MSDWGDEMDKKLQDVKKMLEDAGVGDVKILSLEEMNQLMEADLKFADALADIMRIRPLDVVFPETEALH